MSNATDNLELLYEKAKRYTETSIELYKLQAVDKSADIASSIVSSLVIGLAVAMFMLFLNIGLSLLLGDYLDNIYLGFFIVSGIYLILAIVLNIFKKDLVKIPITNLVIGKLLTSKTSNTSILDNFKVDSNGKV